MSKEKQLSACCGAEIPTPPTQHSEEKKEYKYDLGINSTCISCEKRFCICPERQTNGDWISGGNDYPNFKQEPSSGSWEEPLAVELEAFSRFDLTRPDDKQSWIEHILPFLRKTIKQAEEKAKAETIELCVKRCEELQELEAFSTNDDYWQALEDAKREITILKSIEK